jgi:hypothetical protein
MLQCINITRYALGEKQISLRHIYSFSRVRVSFELLYVISRLSDWKMCFKFGHRLQIKV